MKIFFGANIQDMTLSVKIVNDIGDFIVLEGKDCRDLIPYYGIELNEGEQQRLTKWLSEHK